MSVHHETLMTDVLFGDATKEERVRLERHLQECAHCRSEFESLSATLDAARHRPSFEASQESLETLEHVVLARTRSAGAGKIHYGRWVTQAAAVAALLLVGILIGRSIPGPQTQPDTPAAAVLTADETRAYAYLNRSKTVLLGVANFDAASEDPASLNLPKRSAIADELLQEASYLKSTLSEIEQQGLKALVSDLEIILLQLANLEERADVPEIEIMQAGMDQNALLFKIDVEQMRRIQNSTEPDRDTPSSV